MGLDGFSVHLSHVESFLVIGLVGYLSSGGFGIKSLTNI
jgi:hypothetical protein